MGEITPSSHRAKTGAAFVVRSAAAADALSVLEHVRAVIADGEGMVSTPDEFTITPDQEEDWIRRHAEDSGQLAIVAEAAGQIIGLAHLEAGTRCRLAHRALLAISIAKNWRGQGVGAALLRELIDWAESHPMIEKLSLGVLATNQPAIALYRKMGFIEEGRGIREFKLAPGHYVDDLLMYRWCGALEDD